MIKQEKSLKCPLFTMATNTTGTIWKKDFMSRSNVELLTDEL